MQILAVRSYPFIELETLIEAQAREILIRERDGFYLYMSSEGASVNDYKVLRLDSRDALVWLNEKEDDYGEFWRCMQNDSGAACQLPPKLIARLASN